MWVTVTQPPGFKQENSQGTVHSEAAILLVSAINYLLSLGCWISSDLKKGLLLKGELKILPNRSKYPFLGKKMTIYHRKGNTTFI